MKAAHNQMVACVKSAVQGKAWLFGILLAVASVGCENYTSAPLCTDANETELPNLPGVYEYTTQDAETFVTSTDVVDLSGGKMTAKLGKVVGANLDNTRTCKIGDIYVNEEFNEDVQGYAHWAIHADDRGLEFRRIFFDAAGLENAGVKYKIFEMPETMAKTAQKVLSAAHRFGKKLGLVEEDKKLGIMVDNADQSPEAIMSHAHRSLAVIYLDRR